MSASCSLIIELSGNEKLQKNRLILSQHNNYLHNWLVLFWNVYFFYVYFFFLEILKYMQAKNNILSPLTGWSTWITILRNCDSMLIELAGNDECWLPRFHTIRNFLANESYHFSRLSHETGCLFTWAAHSKKSVSYSANFACSRMPYCKKYWGCDLEMLSPFFSECSFQWLQQFFHRFGYLFVLIFPS